MDFDKKQFEQAIQLWSDWNSKINVISRKDTGFLYEHHILHSLSIARLSLIGPGDTVLDLGTGGGFPGIPLAMVLPETEFTLCDSIGKKIKVAQAVCDGLGLKNTTCVNARAESLDGPFDWVVSRAVTSLDNFFPWVKGMYRKGILCLKGGDVNSEISEFIRKCKVSPSKISVHCISDLIQDEYYSEKYIVEIKA